MNKALLLVVDMQKGFVRDDKTRHIVPVVNELLAAWQTKGWPVAYSRFINLPGSNFERLRDWRELQGEPQTELLDELEVVSPYVLKKSTYAAWSDEVIGICAAAGVRDVVIVGVDTNECVLATALAVFDSGYTPWVVRATPLPATAVKRRTMWPSRHWKHCLANNR
jgi:nicotinamidase-related amidase